MTKQSLIGKTVIITKVEDKEFSHKFGKTITNPDCFERYSFKKDHLPMVSIFPGDQARILEYLHDDIYLLAFTDNEQNGIFKYGWSSAHFEIVNNNETD